MHGGKLSGVGDILSSGRNTGNVITGLLTTENDVLMSYDEIDKLNKETIAGEGTNM